MGKAEPKTKKVAEAKPKAAKKERAPKKEKAPKGEGALLMGSQAADRGALLALAALIARDAGITQLRRDLDRSGLRPFGA